MNNPLTEKPLAAEGWQSYRYESTYGWIMIGAKDDEDALNEAKRSLRYDQADMKNLEKWDGQRYVRCLPPDPAPVEARSGRPRP